MRSFYGMVFRQLLPEPGEVEIEALVGGLRLADRAPGDRPYTLANLVSSVDGRATFQGQSTELGDDGDLAVFRTLRREVDAVLVGTGTAREEHYGRLIKSADARERRVQRGLAPEPLAVMVTRSGRVPFEIPLFAEPEARVVVFGPAELDAERIAAGVEVVPIADAEHPFAAALGHLHHHDGVRTVLCEGGPTVLSALVRERVLDELFITLAPALTGGGTGPSLTTGPELPELTELQIGWALERNGSLFLRYRLHA